MNFSVNWSPDLKALADDLLEKWKKTRLDKADPFAKTCIVINDAFTEKWLKKHFLLEHRIPQIMMDLEFVRLPEFVNDWLWAVLHHKSPRERDANQHPYSKNVLSWRIYNILENAAPDGEFKELLNYVNGGNGKHAEKRFAMSAKLANLYDEYLDSRFWMLREWEENTRTSDYNLPEWEIALYQKLAQDNRNTYALEYELALQADAKKAFDFGFPKYKAVFLFDIPFMSQPTLRLLEKMSEAMPMTFWLFNPKDDWLAETNSEKEAKRKLRQEIRTILQKHRDALEKSQKPDEIAPDLSKFYDSPEERLLGSLAAGARGVIGELFDYCGGNVEPIDGRLPLEDLSKLQISVHSTYSPRRELEAVRDGLHDFLKTEGNAPRDALVLCAAWETYAPIIDSVFSPTPGADGYIPITTESTSESSPLFQSFEKLLEFRKNRFEVSDVFELLAFTAIRAKFGLDEDNVDALRNMVKKANIHWGYDDADVKRILNSTDANTKYPFTWERGLDRLTTELLHGFPDNDELLLTVGNIPAKLHPCGHVEGERAQNVAGLWNLVDALKKLRDKLASGKKKKPLEMRSMLLDILDTFYDDKDNSSLGLNTIRKEIRAVCDNMLTAGLNDHDIEIEVFLQAILSTLDKQATGRNSSTDTVQFAPLNAYTATPHKFIWICGLNDGKFPRMDHRSSFDVIGRHPTLFDTTSREKDAFALLKAMLCAENRLALSYVGKEMRTNDDIPSSVLLTNLTDYFNARNIKFDLFKHPLQGYSRRYFYEWIPHTKDDTKEQDVPKLPPGYSERYREMAALLADSKQEPVSIVPFPLEKDGPTRISLDALVEFFAHPNSYLFKRRLGAATPWNDTLDDDECMETKLDKTLKRRLALESVPQGQPDAALTVETGTAPDEAAGKKAINLAKESIDREIAFFKPRTKQYTYACLDDTETPLNLAATYKQFLEIPLEEKEITLQMPSGQVIVLTGSYGTISLKTMDEELQPHTFLFYDKIYDSTKVEIKIRHLAINAVLGGGVATIAFSPDEEHYCPAIDGDEATAKLRSLLERATGPAPEGYPDICKTAPKDDKLPPEWLIPLDGITFK